jgi:hypothetical protein
MKWMGWSYADLYEAPPEYVTEIVQMMNEEQAELEKLRNK